MKQKKHMNVKLSKGQRVRAGSPSDIAHVMRTILLRDNLVGREREHFWVVGLDASRYIQYVELISLGTKTSTPAEPVEVFKWALQKGVSSIILCHSHSTHHLTPSTADKFVTERMLKVGVFIGIVVEDHIIINSKNDSYLSFSEVGLLDELKKGPSIGSDGKDDEQVALLKALAVNDAVIGIIKEMKKKRIPVKTIAAITKMPIEIIRKTKP